MSSALLGLAMALLPADSASACTRPVEAEFSLDPALAGVDRQPPERPTAVRGTATRTSGSFCASDGICVVSTCGSVGSLQVELTPGLDERARVEELGYRLRWVEGNLPVTLEAPLRHIVVGLSPLRFELPFDPVPELDATFELIAIDRAGNESDPSEPFHVAFDGCTRSVGMAGCAEATEGRVYCADGACFETKDASGCAVAVPRRASAAGMALVLLAGAGVLGRRRRKPHA